MTPNLKCTVLLPLLLVAVRAVTSSHETQLTSLPSPGVVAVQGVLTRLLGVAAANKFHLSIAGNSSLQEFTIEASAADSPSISGTNPVALSSGVMWYLKYHAEVSISWGVNGTGNNLRLPSPLPAVSSSLTMRSNVPYRYYSNVCTVSYSYAWWDWARWEIEIDWMALNGINLPLAFTGQEHVLALVFSKMNVTESQLDEFFGGPAFLAWQRMGNIRGWGGPLGSWWRDAQFQLQPKILKRMRELGMTPVLPAFAGHVPEALTVLYPNASITRSSNWGNFPNEYCCAYLLDSADPLYAQIGKAFVEAQRELYGGEITHVYNADTFNEMDPPTSDPSYLKAASAAVYNALIAADPDAIWLMQGWLFHSGFWTDEAMAAYLSGVPDDRMIILDLNSEASPLWTRFVKNDKRFVWNMLHNYGGERSLYGDIDLVATHPLTAFANAEGKMVGTGLTMEAIEQNPIMYELMNEMGWRSSNFSTADWVANYTVRRYGGASASAQAAWVFLHSGLYDAGFSWEGNSAIVHLPRLGMSLNTSPNTTALVDAWRLFVASASEFPDGVTDPWHYDLVDITRQALSNLFFDLYQDLETAFGMCTGSYNTSYSVSMNTDNPGHDLKQVGNCGLLHTPPTPCNITFLKETCDGIPTCAGFNSNGYLKTSNSEHKPSEGTNFYSRQSGPPDWSKCHASVLSLTTVMTELIDDFAAILATDVNYLMGVWVHTARSWAVDDTTADLLEFNARNQVTLWGPTGEINDYAAKQWSGLVEFYHRSRWSLFFSTLVDAINDQQMPDWDEYDSAILVIAQAFGGQTDPNRQQFPTTPSGNALALAQDFLNKYATLPPKGFVQKHDTTAATSDMWREAWTADVGQLGFLCTANPDCVGFTTTGMLLRSSDALSPMVGVSVFLKQA